MRPSILTGQGLLHFTFHRSSAEADLPSAGE
jgi:hypothetical protein